MAKDEIKIRFACQGASRQRGGNEHVTLVPARGKANAQFFHGQPQGSFNFVIDNPEGQGLFDPEMDYEVTFRPVAPAE
jgi:hypothetical protein